MKSMKRVLYRMVWLALAAFSYDFEDSWNNFFFFYFFFFTSRSFKLWRLMYLSSSIIGILTAILYQTTLIVKKWIMLQLLLYK